MKLDKLSLTAFGRFHRQSLDLSPGLNIIYGPNEAGKSTLQKFLLGMLYGFKKRAARREYTDDVLRYRPWQGNEYRGALLYTLGATGQQYRIERQFEPGRDEVKVFDAITGADVTGSFPMDRRKEVLFAEAHLGLPEEVFTSTAWVGQMQVSQLEAGKELLARVANLQDSGREDLSVKAAIRALEDRMKEIGTERALTRPYGRVLKSIDDKRQELERAQRAREETRAWESRLTEVQAILDELNLELNDLERRLQWAQWHEAKRELNRQGISEQKLTELKGRLTAHAAYKEFPAHLKSDLLRWQSEAQGARGREERLTQRLRDLAMQEGELRAALRQYGDLADLAEEQVEEAAATLHRLDLLSEQADRLTAEAERLHAQLAELDRLIEPVARIAKQGDKVLAKLEEIDKEAARLRRQSEGHNLELKRHQVEELKQELAEIGGGFWLGLGLIGSVAGALITTGYGSAVGLPADLDLPVMVVAYFVALVGLGLWIKAKLEERKAAQALKSASAQMWEEERVVTFVTEQVGALERSKEQHLREAGAVSASEVRNQVVRYEQLTARRDGIALRLETLQGEQDRVIRDLERGQSLVAGIHTGGSSTQAVGQVRDLRRQLAIVTREYQEAVRLHNAEAEAAREATEALTEALSAAGVTDMASFDEGCARRDAYLQAASELSSLESTLTALVSSDTKESVAATLEQLEHTLTGEAPAGLEPSAQLQAEIRRREGRKADLGSQASDLAARIETALKEMDDIADLRRELDALQEEKLALDAELQALELAKANIEAVGAEMHREFAPRLNRALGDIVESLTDGKYMAVQVDEELGIRVLTADEQTVDLHHLSGGTVDQFYLGLRLALLDLVKGGDEQIPLILDDPFTQYDDQRTQAALEFLAGVAEERQVLLLTCHQREVRMAKVLGLNANLIELAGGAS